MFVVSSCDVRFGFYCFFFFQAEDVIRDLVRSRGLGDVYKRQDLFDPGTGQVPHPPGEGSGGWHHRDLYQPSRHVRCLLYTSDAADERSSVDLGGRRIIKKKQTRTTVWMTVRSYKHTHNQQGETAE